MTLVDTYRANAEDCMRFAASEAAENDVPLWATLARSWLQLAEEFGRIGDSAEAEEDAAEPESETADEQPATN